MFSIKTYKILYQTKIKCDIINPIDIIDACCLSGFSMVRCILKVNCLFVGIFSHLKIIKITFQGDSHPELYDDQNTSKNIKSNDFDDVNSKHLFKLLTFMSDAIEQAMRDKRKKKTKKNCTNE